MFLFVNKPKETIYVAHIATSYLIINRVVAKENIFYSYFFFDFDLTFYDLLMISK